LVITKRRRQFKEIGKELADKEFEFVISDGSSNEKSNIYNWLDE